MLDDRVLHATLRFQPDQTRPTNSLHGGSASALSPAELPAPVRALAVRALRATGNRYGSVDILGGLGVGADLDGTGRFAVVRSPPAVVCEVNGQPGGRGPGFRARVLPALVDAYLTEIDRSVVSDRGTPG